MNQTTDVAALCLIAFSVIVNGLIYFTGINAGYGRYQFSGVGSIGFALDNKLAWVIQECPTVVVPIWYLSSGNLPKNWTGTICLGMFLVHYSQRTLVYPFLIRGNRKTQISMIAFAFLFCFLNGLLQSIHMLNYQQSSALLIPGTLIFAYGFIINLQSEDILRNLREPGKSGYYIPRGGMFEYVSCANYMGECIEWVGYAIASGFALPPLMFAIFTFCFIGRRALSHHEWYKAKFDDYPINRKALIPFLL